MRRFPHDDDRIRRAHRPPAGGDSPVPPRAHGPPPLRRGPHGGRGPARGHDARLPARPAVLVRLLLLPGRRRPPQAVCRLPPDRLPAPAESPVALPQRRGDRGRPARHGPRDRADDLRPAPPEVAARLGRDPGHRTRPVRRLLPAARTRRPVGHAVHLPRRRRAHHPDVVTEAVGTGRHGGGPVVRDGRADQDDRAAPADRRAGPAGRTARGMAASGGHGDRRNPPARRLRGLVRPPLRQVHPQRRRRGRAVGRAR